MRVLHTVEHEQEGWFLECVEHVVKRDMTLLRRDMGDNALMPRSRCHRLQPLAVDGHQLDPGAFGVADQIARARASLRSASR